MRDRRALRESLTEQFGPAYEEVEATVDRLMADTRPPRALTDVLDFIAPLPAGGLAIDAGSNRGKWAVQIRKRHDCRIVAVDLVHGAMVLAAADGLPAVTADIEALPVGSGVADLVWCRDMLECVPDPEAAVSELARVLKGGGQLVLYVAFTTPALERREAERLITALDMPDWWAHGRRPVEDAIARSGLEVRRAEPISPEHQERALLDGGGLARDLAILARLQRERDRCEAAMGRVWYERWRAWLVWAPYLILGKLETVAWDLRRR